MKMLYFKRKSELLLRNENRNINSKINIRNPFNYLNDLLNLFFSQDSKLEPVLISNRKKSTFLFALIGFLMLGSIASAQFSSVPVTGYTADVVADGAVGAGTNSTTNDVDGAAWVFVSTTFNPGSGICSSTSTALPATNLLSSLTTAGLTYTLQPYNANNSLRITSGGSGTLTLTTPVSAANLYLLATGGSGACTITATVNFSDATTQVITGSAADWCSGTGAATTVFYRISRTATTCTGGTCQYLYDVNLPLSGANYSKTITSISIASTGGILNVMGVGMKAVCAVPTDQATGLSFSGITSGSISGSFTAAAGSPAGYLVVRYPAGATTTTPAIGTTYSSFQSIGLGTVVQSSALTTFTSTSLSGGTSYDYYIYSYNTGATCGGPVYLSAGALSGNQATAPCGVTISGTIPIGPGLPNTPAGGYTNITNALTDINVAGLAGPTILELQSGYTTAYAAANEVYPITFPTNPCITSLNNLTIRPVSGTTTPILLTSNNATATVIFNGAANITIDGQAGGTGGVSYLTISNTNLGASAAVQFVNDAQFNTIRYCTLTSKSTTASSGTIIFGAGVVIGNDNNTIDNCTITDDLSGSFPVNGIYSAGTSAAVDNSGNTISNCNISNYFSPTLLSSGILLTNTGNSGWTITGNKLFQTANRVYTTGNIHNGIAVLSGSGYTITGNTIGFANAAGTGTTNMIGNSTAVTGVFPSGYTVATTNANTTRYIAINCAFTAAGAVSNIQGNTIAGFALYTSSGATTTNGIFCGINLTSGNANIGTTSGNTIGSTTGNSSIYALATTGGGAVVGIYATSTNTVTIQNNSIGAIDAVGSTTTLSGAFTGIDVAGTLGVFTISNNTIGNASAGNIRIGYTVTGSNLSNSGTLTSTTGTVSPMVGIRHTATGPTVVISGNTLRGWICGTTSGGQLIGIVSSGAVTSSSNINGNFLGTASTGWVTYQFANTYTTNTAVGISLTGTGGALTHNIQNNDFRGITYAVSGSMAINIINLAGATAGGNTATISGNTFTNLSIASTGTLTLITQSYVGSATSTKNNTNNSIVTALNRTAATGSLVLITDNGSSVAGCVSNCTNNNFSNITVAGTSTIVGLNFTDGGTAPTRNITGNTLNNWIAITGSVNAVNVTYLNGVSTIANNTITSITGQSTLTGITIGSVINSSSSTTIGPNTITGLTSTGTGGNVTGITCANSSPLITISGNTINTLSSSGASSTVTGIAITGASLTNVNDNRISGLSGTGATAPLANGISVSGGSTVNLNRNKITDLSQNATLTSTSAAVNGILFSAGTNVTAFNNIIGDFRTPAISNADAIRGIAVTSTGATTNYNIYNNTIYLSASSSGANFGSSGIFHTASATATTAKLDLRNNIVVNTSVPTGTGITSALRRSAAATLANYAVTSNNNMYYVGTPGAFNAIMNDNGTVYGTAGSGFAFGPASTAGSFQNFVTSSRESASLTEAVSSTPGVFFQSLTSSSSNYLHIVNGLTSQIESGGISPNIVTFATDYDGDIRAGSAGYAGTGTAPDLGADEYEGISSAPTITAVSFTPGGSQCVATGHLISATLNSALGSVTGAIITINFNGVAQSSVAMSNSGGAIWTGTIPAAVPGNANVTWSIIASNSLSLTSTYIGTPYKDEPLTGITATVTSTVNPICAGDPTVLTAALGSPFPAITGYLWSDGSTTSSITVAPSVTTGYSCTISSLGCTTVTNTLSVVVNPLPAAPVATPSTQCGIGIPLASVASASGLPNPQFFWYSAASAGTLLQTPPLSNTLTTYYSNDFSSPTLTNSSIVGAASIAGGTLTLQPAIVSSQGNGFTVNASGLNSTQYQVDFDFAVSATGTQIADGFSYNFADDASASATTPSAEHGNGSKLKIGFFTFNTANAADGKGIYLMYNCTAASGYTSATPGVLAYSTNVSWIPVSAGTITSHITATINAAGQLTMSVAGVPVFTNVQLPPAFLSSDKSTWKHVFCSRSGGVAGGFAMDNLIIQTNSFGTGYTTYQNSISTPTTFYVIEKNPATGCISSPRTPLLADVTTGDAVTPSAQISSSNITSLCIGGTFDLSLSQSGPNGNNYTYAWTASSVNSGISGTVSGGTFASPATLNVTPTAPGTYIYTVTYSDGVCNGVNTITITVSPLPNITSPTATPSEVCSGTPTTLSAISINALPGTATVGAGATSTSTYNAPFYSLWSNKHEQILITAAELTAAGLVQGNITSLSFPTTSGTVSNKDYTIKMIATSATDVNAFVTGSFTTVYTAAALNQVAGTNNTVLLTTPFNWNGSSNIVIELCWGDNTTTATLSSTSPADNTSYTSVRIQYNSAATSGSSICATGANTLTYAVRPKILIGGQVGTVVTNSLTWTWNPGSLSGSTVVDNPVNLTNAPIAIPYSVTAFNAATGCSSTSSSVNVIVNPNPTTPNALGSTQCGYGIPTASVSTTSGTISPVFKWYSAASGGTLLQNSTSSTFTGFINASTTFYVSEAFGICESPRVPVTVTVNQPDPITLISPVASCIGSLIPFSVSQTGSTNSYVYTWSANPVIGSGVAGSPTGASQTFTPTLTGTYIYTVIGYDAANSCTAIDTQMVVVYGGLTGTVSATQITSCTNPTGLITANVSGAGTIVNNDFTSSVLPSNMVSAGNDFAISGGRMQLTSAANSKNGGVLITNTTGLANNDFQIDFDMITTTSSVSNSPADGFSYSYGDDVVALPTGTAGTGVTGITTLAPENGSGTKLKLSFDAINNTGGCTAGTPGAPSSINNGNVTGVYLMYNSTTSHQGATCPGVIYFDGGPSIPTYTNNIAGPNGTAAGTGWRATTSPGSTTHVTIKINALGQVSLWLNNVQVVFNQQLPASYLTADKSTWKHSFCARTGGLNQGHFIDNLLIQYNNFYEYSIDGGTSWSTVNPIIPPGPGTYSVQSRYAAVPGCSVNLGSVTIDNPSFTTTATASSYCTYGTPPTLGFTPSFGGATYQWESSPAGSNTWTPIVGATSDTYTPGVGTLLVNTDFRCVISCAGTPIDGSPTIPVSISVEAPVVNTVTDGTRCGAGTVDLLASVSSGATANWYTALSGGTAISTGSPFTTPILFGTTAYYVSAKTLSGCESGRTLVNANITTAPAITVSNAITICQTDSTILTVSSANDPNYRYTWSPGGFIGSSYKVAPNATTTYTVTALDTTGGLSANCQDIKSVTVTVNQRPTISSITYSPSSICSGDSAQITLVATPYIPPSGAYTMAPSSGSYTPLVGGTLVPDILVDDAASAALPIGFSFNYNGTSYNQVYASSNGILTFGSANSSLTNNISGTASPIIAPLWDDLQGSLGTASYLTTGSPGSRVFTFEWLNWRWYYTVATPTISFQVRLYEANGKVEFVYNQESTALNGSEGASIGMRGVGAGTVVCLNNSTNAPVVSSTETTTINVKPATGQIYTFSPPVASSLTYAWTPAGSLNNATISNPKSGLTTTTTYYVTVNETGTGCFRSDSITIATFPLPQPKISQGDTLLCFPDEILLFVNDTGAFTGGYPVGTTVEWLGIVSGLSPATGISSTNGSVYQAKVVLPNGCFAYSNIVNVITRSVTVVPVISPAACGNNSGKVIANITAGNAPFHYVWTDGVITVRDTVSSSTSDSLTNLAPGTYYLTIYDNYGLVVQSCNSGAIPLVVPGNAPLVASISASTNVSCNNAGDGSATVGTTGGSGVYTYLWSSGQSSASIFGLIGGTYTVTVSDQFGCSDTAVVVITEPAPIVIGTLPTAVTCNGGSDGTITANVSGGTAPYQIDWFDGSFVALSSGPTLTGQPAGLYFVVITDTNGCFEFAQETITEPVAVVISSFTPSNGSTGTVVTINGGDFTGTTNVLFNGVSAASFTVVNSGEITAVVPSGASTGLISVVNGSCSVNSTGTFTFNSSATLNVTAIIEGYYIGGGQMTSTLLSQGVAAAANECDTITVELRDQFSPATVVASVRTVLHVDGQAAAVFPGALSGGSYYVVVLHRNALQTWSALPVTLSGNTSYNFTTANGQSYGSNMKLVDTGIWAMYSGDIEPQDEFIDVFDQSTIDNDAGVFAFGYYSTDVNGDGFVDVFDQAIVDNNATLFIFSAHP